MNFFFVAVEWLTTCTWGRPGPPWRRCRGASWWACRWCRWCRWRGRRGRRCRGRAPGPSPPPPPPAAAPRWCCAAQPPLPPRWPPAAWRGRPQPPSLASSPQTTENAEYHNSSYSRRKVSLHSSYWPAVTRCWPPWWRGAAGWTRRGRGPWCPVCSRGRGHGHSGTLAR